MATCFGAVFVKDGNFSGSLTSLAEPAALGRVAALKSLTVLGSDFTGDIRLLGAAGPISVKSDRSGEGGSLSGATVTASRIAALTVARNVTGSVVLAGADLGADHVLGGTGPNADSFAAGAIGSVTIGSRKTPATVTASVIGAGLNPVDALFDNSNDTIVNSVASIIGKFTIVGTADVASTHFAAGEFKKAPVIDGDRINTGADGRFFTM